MTNVFIDTSVFCSENFIKGTKIKTLFEAGEKSKIQILLPEITEKEVIKHLSSKVEEWNGANAIHKLESSFIEDAPGGAALIKKLKDLKSKLPETIIKRFLSLLKSAKVVRIPLQKNLDYSEIFEKYWKKEAPFSVAKPKEFPDAFVLMSLEKWCDEHNQTCILLSNDDDIKSYESARLSWNKVDEFVEKLAADNRPEEIVELLVPKLKDKVLGDEACMSELQYWINDVLSNDVLYCCALQIEDINDYSIKICGIEFDKPFTLSGVYKGSYIFRGEMMASINVVVNHPNFDTAYWDSEDQKYYFIDEDVASQFDFQLMIPVEISCDAECEDVVVESINDGKFIKMSELLKAIAG